MQSNMETPATIGFGRGGGLTKTSSWTTAFTNATSYIILTACFHAGSYDYQTSITIPKDDVSDTNRYFVGGGYFNTGANSNFWLQILATTSLGTPRVYTNGVEITTATFTYYYD